MYLQAIIYLLENSNGTAKNKNIPEQGKVKFDKCMLWESLFSRRHCGLVVAKKPIYLHFALAEKRAFCVFHDISCLEPSHAALLLEVMEVNRQLGGLSNRIWTLSISSACASVCVCVGMC